MEIRNIKTFIQVAELNNFSKAAGELGYTQSTVTMQIKQLEEELATQLFDRNGKRVSLSESGKKFLEYAYSMVRCEAEAKDYFLMDKEPEGELRIGIMESICASDYADFFFNFQKKYHKISLKMYICTTFEAMDLLEKGKLDVILTLDRRVIRPHWLTETEIMEEISFFCASSHPFAKRASVSIKELLQEKFILIESGCNYRQVFEQDMQEMGHSVVCRMEIGHTRMIIDAVSEQLGISLLPDFTLKMALQQNKIVRIPLADYGIRMAIQVIYDKYRWVSPVLRTFLKSISDYSKNHDLLDGSVELDTAAVD